MQSKGIRRNHLRHSLVLVCSLVCHYGCLQLFVMGLPQLVEMQPPFGSRITKTPPTNNENFPFDMIQKTLFILFTLFIVQRSRSTPKSGTSRHPLRTIPPRSTSPCRRITRGDGPCIQNCIAESHTSSKKTIFISTSTMSTTTQATLRRMTPTSWENLPATTKIAKATDGRARRLPLLSECTLATDTMPESTVSTARRAIAAVDPRWMRSRMWNGWRIGSRNGRE